MTREKRSRCIDRWMGATAMAAALLGLAGCGKANSAGPDGGTPPAPDSGPAVEVEGTWIDRDAYGTPYIYAETMEDAAYAFGYAMAQDHGEAMVRLYIRASGRSLEFLGDGDGRAVVGTHCRDDDDSDDEECWQEEASNRYWDNLVHLLDVPDRTARLYPEMAADARAWVEAFTRGVNRSLDEQRGDPRLDWIGDLEITPQMVVALDRFDVLNHQFAAARADITLLLSGETVCPTPVWDGATGGASNGWAIGSPLASGAVAIVGGDPHMTFDLDPIDNLDDGTRKYEAHFLVSGRRFGGKADLGTPVATTYTDRVALAGTASRADIADAYHLVRVSGTTVQIGTSTEDLGSRVRTVTLPVLGADPTTMRFIDSSLGPVVCPQRGGGFECTADEDVEAFALVLPSLDHLGTIGNRHEILSLTGIPDMVNGAPERGIRGLADLGQDSVNLMAADRDGRVLYHLGARMPWRRDESRCYELPLESTWTDALPEFDGDGRLVVAPYEDHPTIGSPFEGMPSFYLPTDNGYVVDNNVWPQFVTAGLRITDLPWHPGIFDPSQDEDVSFRNRLARERLDAAAAAGTFTLEQSMELAMSVEVMGWRWWKPALEQTIEAFPEMRDDPVVDAALGELLAWDGMATAESRVVALYVGWVSRLDRIQSGRVPYVPAAPGTRPEDIRLTADQLAASRDALVGTASDSGVCAAEGAIPGVITYLAGGGLAGHPGAEGALVPWGNVHRLRLPGETGTGRALAGGDSYLATLYQGTTPTSYSCPSYGIGVEAADRRSREPVRGSSFLMEAVFRPELEVYVSLPIGALSDPADPRYGLMADLYATRQFRRVVLDGPSSAALRLE